MVHANYKLTYRRIGEQIRKQNNAMVFSQVQILLEERIKDTSRRYKNTCGHAHMCERAYVT